MSNFPLTGNQGLICHIQGQKQKVLRRKRPCQNPNFIFFRIILSASFSVHMSTMDSQKRASLMGKRRWREPQSRDALTASRGKNHHVRRQRRARPPCFRVTEFTALHTRCLLPSPPQALPSGPCDCASAAQQSSLPSSRICRTNNGRIQRCG